MNVTTEQVMQNLILTYLAEQPDFLDVIKQKFTSVFDVTQIPMVDKETENRVGIALENFKNGVFITVNPNEDIMSALDNFERRVQDNAQQQLHVSA